MDYRIYAIIRKDLQMPLGKAASQVGHAVQEAFLTASPDRQHHYRKDGMGTKIVLEAGSQAALERLYGHAQAQGLPCFLVEDTGNNTTFHGVPTVSALGIGPVVRDEVPFLKHLNLA